MPAPLSYSEPDLIAYMLDTMGQVATDLKWTAMEPALLRAVWSVQRACGVSNIIDATDMAKVEALANREAWRAASRHTASLFTFGPQQGERFEMGKINDQINTQLALAEAAAAPYLSSNRIGVATLRYEGDPYLTGTDEEFGV